MESLLLPPAKWQGNSFDGICLCVYNRHHHHQLFSHMKHAHTLYRDNSIHMCELDYMSTSDTDNNPEVNA